MVLILIAVILVVSESAMAAVETVYWTDRNGGTVSASLVADGSTSVVVSGFARPQDVDLVSSAGVLYIADWGPVGPPGGEGSINRVNTDGTGLATVLATGDAVHQLVLDPATNRIYFTRAVSYDNREISHVTMAGTNYTVLASTFGWFQSGLALDAANSLLYWGDAHPPRQRTRARLRIRRGKSDNLLYRTQSTGAHYGRRIVLL